MFNQEACIEGLRAQVHAALNATSVVAVLGWRANWHDEWTRLVENQDHAIFFDQLCRPPELGLRVGFVIYTHRVGHGIVQGVKHRKPTAPVCLRPNQIQELFRIWCEQAGLSEAARRRA